MQTIRTRYLPPTARIGPRIRVWTSGGARQLHPAANAPATPADHDAAAVAIARRLRWTGTLIRGDLSFDEAGHVYVFDRGERVALSADSPNPAATVESEEPALTCSPD